MALVLNVGTGKSSPDKSNARSAKEETKRSLPAQKEKETAVKKSGGRASGGSGSGGAAVILPSGGTFSGGGASGSGDAYWESMKGYYETAYADALLQSSEQARQEAEKARARAERESAALEREYAALDRQLYRDYMEQRRTLPLALAAQGYTGGVSESARVRLHNGYEEALAENTRQRIARQSGLEDERARAEEAAASADTERRAKALDSYRQGLMTLKRERHSEDRSDERKRAEVLAASGDFSGYRALGWSEGEIGYLAAVWAAKNPELAAAVYGAYA